MSLKAPFEKVLDGLSPRQVFLRNTKLTREMINAFHWLSKPGNGYQSF